MNRIIGTSPNQIPTNGDLGSSAYINHEDLPVSAATQAALNHKVNTNSLGTAATLNVGTGANTVAAGDDTRITGAAQKSANLNDLTNAATARSNLGLGTAATRNTQTNLTDYEAGKVALVGYAGWGKGCPTLTDFDDVLTPSGNYRYSPSSLNRPAQITEQYGSILILGNGDEGSTSNHVTRLIIGLNSNRIWLQRSVNLAPWTTPVELYHSGNLPIPDLSWGNITGKPANYPTTWGSVASKPAQATRWPSWGEVSGKPGTFTPPTGHGGVGTYAFVGRSSGSTSNWGNAVAGSGLRAASTGGGDGSRILSGTWRIMGSAVNTSLSTVAVRIS